MLKLNLIKEQAKRNDIILILLNQMYIRSMKKMNLIKINSLWNTFRTLLKIKVFQVIRL